VVAGERFEGESLPQSFLPKEDGKYGPPSDLRRAGPPLQLNHYPVQSLTFFETVKMKRGAADTRDNEFIRTRAYFDKCVTIARLYSALTYLPRTELTPRASRASRPHQIRLSRAAGHCAP
jgi:hypothetical protein